jgi:hypothetical protein
MWRLTASRRRLRVRASRTTRRCVARAAAAASWRASTFERSARATRAEASNPAVGRPPAVRPSSCTAPDPVPVAIALTGDWPPPPSASPIAAAATRHATAIARTATRGRSRTPPTDSRRGAGRAEKPHGRLARGCRVRTRVAGAVAVPSRWRADGWIAPWTAAAPSPQKSSAPGTVSSLSRARAREPIGTSSSGGPTQSRGSRTTFSAPSAPVPSVVSRSSVLTDLLRLSGWEVTLPRPPGQVV